MVLEPEYLIIIPFYFIFTSFTSARTSFLQYITLFENIMLRNHKHRNTDQLEMFIQNFSERQIKFTCQGCSVF